MNYYIIILTLILSVIYTLYIFSNVKDKEITDFKSFLKFNLNNFLMIITLYTLNIISLKEVLNDFIKNNLLVLFITSYLLSTLFMLINIYITNKISNIYYEKINKSLNIFNKLSYVIFFPIIFITNLLNKLFLYNEKDKMSEDDFLDIIEQAEELDGITANESKLIKSVLDFDELKVTDIYTPRIDVIAVELNDSLESIKDSFIKSGFSRLPLYKDEIDNILGVINYKDFFTNVLLNKKDIKTIIQEPVEITEYMKVNNLLSLLKINKSHMAIVKDEFGGTLGIATMEDVLEELVGDIFDEHDIVVENIKQISENKYLVLGQTYIDELLEYLNIEDELNDDEDFLTVNGWVLSKLEKVGNKGDTFEYKNLKVEVLKANTKQVLEVKITVN